MMKHCDFREGVPFPVIVSKWLAAFAHPVTRLFSLPRAPQFLDDHGFVILRDRAHDLAEQHPRWIRSPKIRLGRGYQRDPTPSEIHRNVLLNHEIPCQPIKSLYDDCLDSVQLRDHLGPCWTIFPLCRSWRSALLEPPQDPQTVIFSVHLYRRALPGEAIAVKLPST
jgi:hypothetical protein